ncbi:MAG: helix-turn-helix domain-containing protein [Acidimicrobiales bacterium]
MLTVEEAARMLRVGRTLGYQLARRYVKTGGREGLPVVAVGRNLRVPKVLLAKLLAGEISLEPTEVLPPAVPAPRPNPTRRPARTAQLSLLSETEQA